MLRLAFPGAAVLCACLLTGCFGGAGLGCGDTSRYANSRSAAPLRVPDDLSLPDESDSLSVPPPPRGEAAKAQDASADDDRHCLEMPPDFSNKPSTASDKPSASDAPADSAAQGAKSAAHRDRRRRRRRREATSG